MRHFFPQLILLRIQTTHYCAFCLLGLLLSRERDDDDSMMMMMLSVSKKALFSRGGGGGCFGGRQNGVPWWCFGRKAAAQVVFWSSGNTTDANVFGSIARFSLNSYNLCLNSNVARSVCISVANPDIPMNSFGWISKIFGKSTAVVCC